MSNIAISSFNYPYAQGNLTTGTVELRLWFTGGPGEQFIDSLNNEVPYGNATQLYKSVSCTVASNIIVIPTFTIPSTDNSSNISSLASAQFYINGSPGPFLFTDWIVTATLGSSITYAALYIFNLAASIPYTLDATYLTAPQVAALITSAVGSLADATQTIKGRVYASLFDPRIYGAVCDGVTDDTAAFQAANVAAAAAGGSVYVPFSTAGCLVGTMVFTVPVVSDGGSFLLTSGQTTTFTKPVIAPRTLLFRNATSAQGIAALTAPDFVYPEWWTTNTTPGTTNMQAAFVAAENALGNSTGILSLGPTTYLVSGWQASRSGLVVRGSGMNITTIKGTGAGDYVIQLNAISKTRWSDLIIDGGQVKTAAMTMIANSGGVSTGTTSSNVFINVRLKGGTTYSLVLGTAAASDDVSDNTWLGCTLQSDNCSTAQLQIQGTNTAANSIFGGRISTGGSAGGVPINMDAGAIRLYGINLLGVTYAVTKSAGVINAIGCHVEAGGFIHTTAATSPTDVDAPPDTVRDASFATSGANSIYHEASRTMIVEGTRGGGNIRIGTAARLVGRGNNFASGNSYVIEGNGVLIADDAAKGSDVLAENGKLADTFLFGLASAANKVSALWLFDEDGSTTTVTDRGTLGHNITLSSAANLLTPQNRGLATSLLFSQSPLNYWSTADSDDFSFGNGATDTPFTFMVAVQPTSLGAVINTLFGKYNSSTGSGEYLFSVNSGKIQISLNDQSTGGIIGRLYNTSLASDVGGVHVYTATYSGSAAASGIKLYRDGVRVDDTDNSAGVYVAMENTTDVPGNFTFAPSRQVGNARNFGCIIVKEEWTAAQVLRATKLLQAHAAVA